MTKHSDLLFIIRMVITLFILIKIFTNIQTILSISIVIFVFLFLFFIKKTRFFYHIKNIDKLINLYISKIVIKLLWTIIYYMSIPFLKFWLVALNKKNNRRIILSSFDFKSEYKCIIDP
jgi:hypothetical protein